MKRLSPLSLVAVVVATGISCGDKTPSGPSGPSGPGDLQVRLTAPVGALDLFHVENLAIKVRHPLRIRRIERNMANRHRAFFVAYIKSPVTDTNGVAVGIAQLVIGPSVRIHLSKIRFHDVDMG